jgi:hypothetical protein
LSAARRRCVNIFASLRINHIRQPHSDQIADVGGLDRRPDLQQAVLFLGEDNLHLPDASI